MANIEIDGKKILAEPGSMIIEAADNVGIWIPRFCYHKKLSIAANCRMCLVDVEKAPKPLPACATPITEGMKIFTRSPRALLAQKAVMEFLLINHPLDCPICDQGGECELQDISMGYGRSSGEFTEGKRSVLDQNLGPLIASDMTRCIQCTRCVRFGTEVAGMRELGATGRGEHMEIGTFVERNIESEVSGNVIDLCPVGALTSKPFRFTARAWELAQHPGISPHDCMGSNLNIHVRRNEVMRVVPRENEAINEVWLSDRDRYSYQGLYHQRLKGPMIKLDQTWVEMPWAESLEYAANGLRECVEQYGGEALAGLASSHLTTEEYYIFQKFLRGMGSSKIDHRLRQIDFRDQHSFPAFPHLGLTFSELDSCDHIVIIGSDPRAEQPVFGLKLRKLSLMGKKIYFINPIDFEYHFEVAASLIVEGGDLLLGLHGVVQDLEKRNGDSLEFDIAQALKEGTQQNEKIAIILGALTLQHPDYSSLLSRAHRLRELTQATLGILSEGCNAAGAWLAGCLPHRLPGGKSNPKASNFNASLETEQNLKAMMLMNFEPELDCALGVEMLNKLRQIPFIVAITPFDSESLREIAQVILPMSPFSETSGTFINAAGTWQTFKAITTPYEESRPAWKILRVLGNYCELLGFDYESIEEIRSEFEHQHLEDFSKDLSSQSFESWGSDHSTSTLETLGSHELMWVAPVAMYSSDMLVRRAEALQKTHLAQKDNAGLARINRDTATQFGLHSGDFACFSTHQEKIKLPVEIDARVPNGVVMIASSVPITQRLGAPYKKLKVERIEEERGIE